MEQSPWKDPGQWSRWFSKRVFAVCVVLFGLWSLLPREAPEVVRHPRRWPPRTYTVYYGSWDDDKVAQASRFDLAIVQPGQGFDNLAGDRLRRLRLGPDGVAGNDDDTVVLAYLSLGEESGVPEPDGAGRYPERFLDEVTYVFGKLGPERGCDGKPVTQPGHDGLPDENGVWGSFYVDAADEKWRQMVLDRARQLVEKGYDGFFLDTLDTGSQDSYPGTAAGLAELILSLRRSFPEHVLVANRGFYLLKDAQVRNSLDGVMFESLATQWNWDQARAEPNPWLQDNLRLVRETIRPDQRMTLLVLDYLDPGQNDAPIYRRSLQELLEDQPHSLYLTHPWLDRLPPPPALPTPGSLPAPSFEVAEVGPGAVALEGLADGSLDLRYCPQAETLPPFAWKAAGPRVTGLEPGEVYRFAARQVSSLGASDWVERTLQLAESGLPLAPQEVSGQTGDGTVELQWKASAGAIGYEIWQDQERVAGVVETGWKSGPLEPGRDYLFEIVPLAGPGPGVPSRGLGLRCRRLAPPPAPEPEMTVGKDFVELRWGAVEGASLYRAYCIPEGVNWQLGRRVFERRTRFEDLQTGRSYRVMLTSVGGDGVESPYPEGQWVVPGGPVSPTPTPPGSTRDTPPEPVDQARPDQSSPAPAEGSDAPPPPSSGEPDDFVPRSESTRSSRSESPFESESPAARVRALPDDEPAPAASSAPE